MSQAEGEYTERLECKTVREWVPVREEEWNKLEEFSSGVPSFEEIMQEAGLTAPWAEQVTLPGFVTGGRLVPVDPPAEVPLPASFGLFFLAIGILGLTMMLRRL